MSLSPKAGLIITAIIFAVGAWFGQVVEPDPPPKVVTETETETVTETETETVYVTPDACVEAARLATRVSRASGKIDIAGSEMLRIMSELRIAVVMEDSNAANDLETELRRIQTRYIGAIETLAVSDQPLIDATEECEQ